MKLMILCSICMFTLKASTTCGYLFGYAFSFKLTLWKTVPTRNKLSGSRILSTRSLNINHLYVLGGSGVDLAEGRRQPATSFGEFLGKAAQLRRFLRPPSTNRNKIFEPSPALVAPISARRTGHEGINGKESGSKRKGIGRLCRRRKVSPEKKIISSKNASAEQHFQKLKKGDMKLNSRVKLKKFESDIGEIEEERLEAVNGSGEWCGWASFTWSASFFMSYTRKLLFPWASFSWASFFVSYTRNNPFQLGFKLVSPELLLTVEYCGKLKNSLNGSSSFYGAIEFEFVLDYLVLENKPTVKQITTQDSNFEYLLDLGSVDFVDYLVLGTPSLIGEAPLLY
ncbi:hypothetical protein V2J09_011037 [Rumex salicifolius]